MTASITLSDAITALVAEKRAVGYKYRAEQQVLNRFEVFSRSEFPGLDTLTEASVQAWITAARQRGVKPATLQGLAAPIRELARWLGRRGVTAYLLPAAALPRPARYVPHIYTDQQLAALFQQTDHCRYCCEVPLRHLVMPVLFRTIYACGLRCSEARLLRADDVDIDAGVLQIRDAKGGRPAGARLRSVTRQARRLPRPGGWATGPAGMVLPRQTRPAPHARQHRAELPPVFVASPHLPRRARTRPPCARSTPLGGRRGYAPCRRVCAGGGLAGSVFVRIILAVGVTGPASRASRSETAWAGSQRC
jgi:integrase